jgi:hypothetical protein
MLKYILCFVPALLSIIIIPTIGFVFGGTFDPYGKGSQIGPPVPATTEDIIWFTIIWVLITGGTGAGLAICMGIYDFFYWWEKSRDLKRIERIMAEDKLKNNPQ